MDTTRHLLCPRCGRLNRVPTARLGERPRCGACKQALFAPDPVALDQASFDRYLELNELPVVVDFWAPWCGPCRSFAPIFAAAGARLAGRALLARLDTEAAPALSTRLGIRSIPTVIVFDRGREIARRPGASDLGGLVQFITAALPAAAA
jgi:thioredoxin 2